MNPPTHAPGSPVRLISSDPAPGELAEYGTVICSWVDELGDENCYVAFYGMEEPDFSQGQPSKPYVLRYYAGSLTPGW